MVKLFRKSSKKEPLKHILHNLDIVDIACGLFHTIFLTDEKTLLSQGANTRGQLAIGQFGIPQSNDDSMVSKRKKFQRIRFQPFKKDPVVKLFAGGEFSVFLTRSGKVFTCGANEFRQLGLRDSEDHCTAQLIQDIEDPVKLVACGDCHMVLVTTTNMVYCCGSNQAGQLGLDSVAKMEKLQYMSFFKGKKIKNVVCGGNSTIFLTSTNEIYCCGRNDDGSLGVSEKRSTNEQSVPIVVLQGILSPTLLQYSKVTTEPIKQIAAGDNHTIITTAATSTHDNIYVAGYNKHFQLGCSDSKTRTQFIKIQNHDLRKRSHYLVYAGEHNSLIVESEENSSRLFFCGEHFGPCCKENSEILSDADIIKVECQYNQMLLLISTKYDK